MPELSGGFWYPEERKPAPEPGPIEDAHEPSARIELETPEGTLILTPENTIVCLYDIGEGEFDHLIHNLSGQEGSMVVFLKDEDPVLREYLEGSYPIYQQSEPDVEVYGHFATAVARTMGETL